MTIQQIARSEDIRAWRRFQRRPPWWAQLLVWTALIIAGEIAAFTAAVNAVLGVP